MECPHCRAKAPPGSTYCPDCGTALQVDQATLRWSADEVGDTEIWSSTSEGRRDAEDHSREEAATDGWSVPTGVPGAGHPLSPGSRLGGRYEIVQQLGEGGMGAVYKARDVELDRLVALKIIRPELTRDPDVLQRFKQEIILARQVTHRNVVRIFDLGQAEGIKFISMEYVEGRDLHGLLKEEGSLPVEEVVEIIEQVCLALSEAHEEGVVHRDLKPHNIMIDGQGRVVVMDFGIARSVQVTGMTQTGSLVGTPDYMSPEQVKGEAVDARSDLFALGVIFFELLTGQAPFEADSPMASMFIRTQSRAKPVRELDPDIPGFLGDVVARCLEISPQRRYQSARELLHDLELWRGGTPRTLSHTLRRMRPARPARARRVALSLTIVAALLVIAAGIALLRSRSVKEAGEAAPTKTVSLAILPFRNVSGDAGLAWFSKGLPEMLQTDIGQSEQLRTISQDRLYQILKDLRLTDEAELGEASRRRIGDYSRAEVLVWGRFVRIGEQIRIDATVEHVKGQRAVPLKVEVADEAELLAGVEQLASLVRENLDLSGPEVEQLAAQAFRPSSDSIEALRQYTQGVELVRLGYNLEAVKHFESSIAADPSFALAHSKLGHAYATIGYGPEAEAAARKAEQLSAGLPPAERYLIQAETARITNEYESGVAAYKKLLEARPRDTDLLYELAGLYEDQADFELAEEHYARVSEIDPQNISALLAVGRVRIKSGQPEDSLEPLNRALGLAIQVENEEARANVLQAIGVGYRFMGRYDDALSNFEQSLEIKRSIGDRRGMAVSLGEIANIQDLHQGKPDQARANYKEAIAISRDIGDDYGLGLFLMNLGDLERTRGRYDDALVSAREALQIQMDMGDEWYQAVSLNSIGNIYALKGQYEDSQVYYQRAFEIRQRLGVPSEVAETLHNLALNESLMGRFDDALDHHMRALEQWRLADDESGEADESQSLGILFARQGRYGAALESLDSALTSFRRLDESGVSFVEALAGHGYVLSLLGRFTEAEDILMEALQRARALGDRSLEALILNYQGERARFVGDATAARTVSEDALEVASATDDPYLVQLSSLNLARAEAMAGGYRAALERLAAVQGESRRLGLRCLWAEGTVERAAALQASRDSEGALRELRAALREVEELGATALLARFHHLMATALRASGKDEEAGEHELAAAAFLRELVEESGSSELQQRADLQPIAAASSTALSTS